MSALQHKVAMNDARTHALSRPNGTATYRGAEAFCTLAVVKTSSLNRVLAHPYANCAFKTHTRRAHAGWKLSFPASSQGTK
eukprot:6189341-Pleurochrysis_carterae.AAC.2